MFMVAVVDYSLWAQLESGTFYQGLKVWVCTVLEQVHAFWPL